MAVLLQNKNRLEDKMNYTILVLLIYAAVMLLSTVLLTQREKSVIGFCVGNRNIGWIVSAFSIAATWIWAPALFTSTETAYTKGFAGLFWFLVPNVLCLVLFIPFAKRVRKEMPAGITLSGYMYSKYKSEGVKNVYSIFAKLFATSDREAMELAEKIVQGIMSLNCRLPVYDVSGENAGTIVKLEPPAIRLSDTNVAQITLVYKVIRSHKRQKQNAVQGIGINKNYD